MASLTRAGRAEILRSAQKDEEFCQELQDELSQVAGELTGKHDYYYYVLRSFQNSY